MNFLQHLSPVTKNLIIVNALVFFATLSFEFKNISLAHYLGLYYFDSSAFKPFQIITCMFTHGSISHFIFNMFAMFSFGSVLERVLGSKKFLILFFIAGIGASALHQFIQAYEIYIKLGSAIIKDTEARNILSAAFDEYISNGEARIPDNLNYFFKQYYIPVVGASGALYGMLTAYAMYFPNSELMLLFLPFPIKAKYFVPILIAIDLYLGIQNFSGDNIAHFAHLGGALFGFLLVKYWNKFDNQNFY